MVCKNCGEKVNEKFEYCPYCGEFLDKSNYCEDEIIYTIYPTCDVFKELIPDLKTILILFLLTFLDINMWSLLISSGIQFIYVTIKIINIIRKSL